jgi:hypothetical protein
MGKAKLPIELKPGLRIGVGVGRLILSHSARKEDGLEMWAVNYQLNADGPIRETFYMSSQIVREILKVEDLEKKSEAQRKQISYWKNRTVEVENQLAKSENLRDVAYKTNKARIDELEEDQRVLTRLVDEKQTEINQLDLKIRSQYNELVRRNSEVSFDFDSYKKEAESRIDQSDKTFKQLHKIIDNEKSQNNIAFGVIDRLKFWNMIWVIAGILFFALWISTMYF